MFILKLAVSFLSFKYALVTFCPFFIGNMVILTYCRSLMCKPGCREDGTFAITTVSACWPVAASSSTTYCTVFFDVVAHIV